MPLRSRPVSRLLPALTLLAAVGASAQQAPMYDNSGDLRQAIGDARRQGADARQRAEKLDRRSRGGQPGGRQDGARSGGPGGAHPGSRGEDPGG